MIRRRIRSLAHGLVGWRHGGPGQQRPCRGAWGASPTSQQLQALESALNTDGDGALGALLEARPGFDPAGLENRRRLLREQFPNARWVLRPGTPLEDGQPTVYLKVTGSRQEGPTTYSLEAEQTLALRSNGQRINGQTVLREQALLRSGEEPLPVSVLIPDTGPHRTALRRGCDFR